MAIIAIVKQTDTWENNFVLTHNKYIPSELSTFKGSAGDGGIQSEDPIESAKKYCEQYSEYDGYHVEIIDTQSPVGTSTHSRTIFPTDDDYGITTWQ